MKPRWAYIWEYTHLESGERRRTCVQVTKAEFHAMTGQFLDESDARAIEETKVDRSVVGYVDPHLKRVPKMPDFVAPSEGELRELWRTNHDPEVRRLILEIVTLRKSLKKIMDWWKTADRAGNEKGVLGGPTGHFLRLYHLLREEMQRAGMM
ncbi:hypothetical protein K6W78_07680 [Burkholderia cepacia]|uniref:hypothetical protein n=1 Tax=Burkholderia cepacia TaxID=292 RepID=UPI001C98E3C0|nr:hypothetical protein [Burkholderia cepacia]MBY4799881.1 hypothetical protein [Burkholderia cepacia]